MTERMKNIVALIVLIGIVGCMTYMAYGGGGGVDYNDELTFDCWPIGSYNEVIFHSSEVYAVAGDFEVQQTGGYGQHGLVAFNDGFIMSFSPPAKTIIATLIATKGTPELFCWQDFKQVGVYDRIYRVRRGAGYVSAGFTADSDGAFVACGLKNGAIDDLILRK